MILSNHKEMILTTLRESLTTFHLTDVILAEADVPPPINAFVGNDYYVVLVLSGTYEIVRSFQHKAIKEALKAGQVLYARPNCWHLPSWQYRCQVLTVRFGRTLNDFSLVSMEPGDDGVLHFNTLKCNTNVTYNKLLGDLIHMCEKVCQTSIDMPIRTHLVQALLLTSCELLENGDQHKISKSQSLFEAVCAYVQEHYQQQFTRDSVAAIFDVTPNHISRVFQTIGKMRFWDYVNKIRLHHAELLLNQSDKHLPLKDIALHCGFSDVNYFCRLFKKHYDFSPRVYSIKYQQLLRLSKITSRDEQYHKSMIG